MLNEEDTNKDGVNTEINTPMNIWGEEEDGGSSLLALVGERPDLGLVFGKRVVGVGFTALSQS